ncbi:hypothetical protein BU25DRAFT_17732 [Macroventuria anomochaeta]|uniref:Uncharacterized protein n=1 Tax=Macroventuria anomochaeta TaxID=301207 RepID=A0ACB6S4V1_9PLEO|nr:uncharacterized protein BU25DRAFT_17732 [Macroventuria anomochaeta]KAF2629186.1 hypothetical protein BU25DRAFT_17732 [Macroventuria anomochaeta]
MRLAYANDLHASALLILPGSTQPDPVVFEDTRNLSGDFLTRLMNQQGSEHDLASRDIPRVLVSHAALLPLTDKPPGYDQRLSDPCRSVTFSPAWVQRAELTTTLKILRVRYFAWPLQPAHHDWGKITTSSFFGETMHAQR